MITEGLSTLKIHKLTQEQYERELAAGNIDETALYLTPDKEIDLSQYVTVEQLDKKADVDHNHDDTYCTQIQIDTILETKADIDHDHNGVYETKTDAIAKLAEAKSYTDSIVNGKANVSHTHTIANITNLQSTLDEKVPTSRTINGKALTSDITLTSSDIGADTSGSASSALSTAKAYADSGDATTLSSAKSYTDDSIINMELITTGDIDEICGGTL